MTLGGNHPQVVLESAVNGLMDQFWPALGRCGGEVALEGLTRALEAAALLASQHLPEDDRPRMFRLLEWRWNRLVQDWRTVRAAREERA